MPTAHLIIDGKVQGVFYRATAKKIADGLSITGWVKNLKNGQVEIIASGPSNNLEEFITWCKKGPEKARVNAALIDWQMEEAFEGFIIKR